MVDIRGELLVVVKALNSAGVPYALCGGLAVGVHGFPRATEDIDLLVLLKDIDAAKKALAECGFTLESERIPLGIKTGKPLELFRVSKVVDRENVMVDLMVVNDDLQGTWDRRQRLDWLGEDFWAVAKGDLIAMKRDAGRPIDIADLEKLEGKDD